MDALVIPYAISTYTVIVHEADEGGYWGEVLELPGCVSQGETLEELKKNIKEAIEAVLEADAQEPHIAINESPVLMEKDYFDFHIEEPQERHRWASTRETWTAVQ